MAAEDYALLVGISRYPGIGDLAGPVNDAKAFEQWLLSKGEVPAVHIHLLASPPAVGTLERRDATPIRDQIINALDAILDNVNDRGKVGRRLYLYLAGHGYAPNVDEAALLMANAGGRSYPAVPGMEFARWFHASAKFDEIVLIMDCCRDQYTAIPPQPLPWPPEESPSAGAVKRFEAFATQAYRKAREKPLPPDGEVRGLFTHALLAALEQANPDENGEVNGSAVKEYILNYMRTLAKDVAQEPEIRVDSAGEVVFRSGASPETLAVEIGCPPGSTGPLRIIDWELNEQPSHPIPADGKIRIQLKPGKYRMEIQGTQLHERVRVIGAPGEVIYVDFR